MILRVKFNKKNYLKYIGHLDLLRLFQRTFRRAGIPVKYSQGFNPHPKFSIANPLSLGIESEGEYMDIELEDKVDIDDFTQKMNQVLPKDIRILRAIYPKENKSISSELSWALYGVTLEIEEDLSIEDIQERLDNWLARGGIIISRLRKQGKRRVMREEDIAPLIGGIDVRDKTGSEVTLEVLMRVGEDGNLRPFDFIDALKASDIIKLDKDSVSLIRKALYKEDGDQLYEPI